METQTTSTADAKNERKIRNRRMGGIVLLAVGAVIFAHEAGAEMPGWLFTWPMIPIVVGVFIGAKHGFRDWGWLIPVAVGALFLANEQIAGFSIGHYFWPIIIIAVGLSMIASRNHRHRCG